MGSESRLETLRKLHNKFVEKKIKNEMSPKSLETIRVIEEIKPGSSSEKLTNKEEDLSKDWLTVKCDTSKTYRFGSHRSNVWDHEWSEPFRYFVNEVENKEGRHESDVLTSNRTFWDEEMSSLITREMRDFESEEEFRSRLSNVSGISNKYI